MKERKISIIGIITTILITSLSFSQDCSTAACLSIENVNTDAGTFDIYMTNQAGCTYCDGGTGGNSEAACTDGGGTWTFDTSMDASTCPDDGQYFNGDVGGFGLIIKGITLNSVNATGGSAANANLIVSSSSNLDCDGSGEVDEEGCYQIIAFSFNPATNNIPADTGLLLVANFTDYNGGEICIEETVMVQNVSGEWVPYLSHLSGTDGSVEIIPELGPCFCGTGVDCAGECGGNAISTDCGCNEVASDGVTGCCADGLGPNDEAPDCADICGGTAVEDACGTCEGNIMDATECECPVSGEVRDCAGVCDGPGVEDCAGECDGPGVENSAGDGACCASGVIDCNNICDGPGVENSAGDGACCASGVIDCNNICDGPGVEDCAGECDGTAVEDCAGECGGDAEKDACNACEGTDQFTCDDGSSCVPFDGTCDNECSLPNGDCSCSGQEFDECNLCGGPGVILPSCDCEYNLFDCADVCDGPGEYLSDGITCCSTGRIDNADTCCDSESIFDCAGICNGTSLLDCAGVCGGDSVLSGCDNACNSTAVEDCSGICGGDDISCLAINELIIPEENSIHNIYPNPFNPITRISYQLPRNSDIQITVYDLNGTEVTTLLNTFQIAGYHTLTWNASSYPSGIYLIRMDSGKFTQTKKVLLVK